MNQLIHERLERITSTGRPCTRLMLLACLSVWSIGCSSSDRRHEDETSQLTSEEARAVQLAERYVALNGYTGRQPAVQAEDRRRQIEFNVRRDSLKPQAYGLARETASGQWLVVFRFSDGSLIDAESKATAGQAVLVDLTTDNVTMVDKMFRLQAVEKKVPTRATAARRP